MGFKSVSIAEIEHNLLSVAHPDTVPASVVAGDLIYGNATPKWARLGIGIAGQFLGVVGGFPTWEDLPTTAAQTYFFTDAASDIGGIYKSMTVAVPGGAETSTNTTVTGANVALTNWATPVGFPSTTFIPAGVWHIHVHAAKTAGAANVFIYANLYKRTAGGVETLLGTFESTTNLTGVVTEYDIHIAVGDVTLLTTDRLVVKFLGTKVGAATDPHVGLYYLGDDASRLDIPVSVSSLDHGTLLGLADDDHTQYALLAGRAGTNAFVGSISALVPSGDTNYSTFGTADDTVRVGVVGGFAGIWINQASPSLSNFSFLGDASFSIFNATDDVYIGTSNTYAFRMYSNRGVGIGDTSGGTGGSSPGTNNLKVDGDINAITSLSVNGKAFSFGANDSAGAGFRSVKIANA